MKNFLLMALLAFTFFACSEDTDLTGSSQAELENVLTPLEGMVEDNLKGETTVGADKDAGDSASDPIIVPASQFVDHVLYTVDVCTFGRRGITGSQESLRTRFGGLFLGARAPVARTRWVPAPSDDCLINNNQAPFNPEFFVGTFYQIFGVVVQLSGPGQDDFWVRTNPNTGETERVNFFADGRVEIGGVVTTPPPVVVPPPAPDICAGVPDFNSRTRYRRGDQVVFNNYLFTRVRRGWRREGRCG